MANYRVELTAAAEKQLKKIPKIDLRRITAALEMLALAPLPQGCRKMSALTDTFRVRIGVYRIIYEIHAHIVLVRVVKIGHRKDVYR